MEEAEEAVNVGDRHPSSDADRVFSIFDSIFDLEVLMVMVLMTCPFFGCTLLCMPRLKRW